MKVWSLVALGVLSLAAVARCGGTRATPSTPPSEHVASADPHEAQAGAPGEVPDAGPPPLEPPRPDPALVQKSLDRSGAAEGSGQTTHGLRFEVVENGPRSGWAMALVNRGSEPLIVAADPSLLTIEVLPPPDPKPNRWAKPKKPRVCRLPPELRREKVVGEFEIVLLPGEGVVEAFDPRLYCLPEQGISPFVAGARVSARFGFAPKTKVVWKGGRHEEPLPEQPPPFVAVVTTPAEVEARERAEEAKDQAEAEEDKRHGRRHQRHGRHRHPRHDHDGKRGGPPDAGAAQTDAGALPEATVAIDAGGPASSDAGVAAGDAGAVAEPVRGVKELVATPVELGSDYAPPPPEKHDSLELELVQGSDALARPNVTVTFKLTNHEKIARRIYVRRELVSFQVTGPDGTTTCDPQPDERAPDRQAYTLLNANGSISLTSRLAELCPDDTFLRPGLYVVEGQLDAFAPGTEHGFDAFVGKLASSHAVVVRVRSGPLPFPGPRVIEWVRVGTP